MRRKLLASTLVVAVALAVMLAVALFSLSDGTAEQTRRNSAVEVSEIVQLQHQAAEGDSEAGIEADQRAEALRQSLLSDDGSASLTAKNTIAVGFAICFVFLLAVALYAFFRVVRPFERLQAFAAKVAEGDLDANLPFERQNLFGDFTWAFDRMSKEIKKSREAEAIAIENNKIAIAALSHDIKTPIASIRAYSEALEIGMGDDPETRQRYLTQIMTKCNEVAVLTDDLFLHSMSDMDRLKMVCTKQQIAPLLQSILADLSTEKTPLRIEGELPDAEVSVDARRLTQAIGNVVVNAAKYAPGSPVWVSAQVEDGMYVMSFKDKGPGVAESDVPFLLDKFYRGANVNQAPGAGLGLAIVSHIMDQLGGTAAARNAEKYGFVVTMSLPTLKRV